MDKKFNMDKKSKITNQNFVESSLSFAGFPKTRAGGLTDTGTAPKKTCLGRYDCVGVEERKHGNFKLDETNARGSGEEISRLASVEYLFGLTRDFSRKKENI